VTVLLRLLTAFVGKWPWSAMRALGAILGWTAGSLLGIRRTHVVEAMRTAGVIDPVRSARAMYRSLGASAMEFLWLAARGEAASGHVRLSSESAILWDQAVSRGRGVVIAASHTGNWDLAACAMARRAPLLVVTKHLRAAGIDQFWQRARARLGVMLVPGEGALKSAATVLRRGGSVAMMIDQVPVSVRGALEIEFLGRVALVDRAPAALAARERAPLVVAAARREPSGDHVLCVLDVLDPPERPGQDWIDSATIAATRALDAFVRTYPSQWLWMHRRWRTPGVAPRVGASMLTAP
jgi:Kdo2-lipid IVA lauroyltransferase/acyltransferase